MWYDTFDSTFWITIVTIMAGILLVVVKQKIRRLIICWGCVEIDRDTHAEERVEEMALNRGINLQNLPPQTPTPAGSRTSSDIQLELIDNRL